MMHDERDMTDGTGMTPEQWKEIECFRALLKDLDLFEIGALRRLSNNAHPCIVNEDERYGVTFNEDILDSLCGKDLACFTPMWVHKERFRAMKSGQESDRSGLVVSKFPVFEYGARVVLDAKDYELRSVYASTEKGDRFIQLYRTGILFKKG